jgi:hypothetical protein
MRLSEGEIETLRERAFSDTIELALEENFEFESILFKIKNEHILANLICDEVSEKIRLHMQWCF